MIFLYSKVDVYIKLQISPEDIQWEDDQPAIPRRGRQRGQGRGFKRYRGRGGNHVSAGRRRGHLRAHARRESLPPQNGIVNRFLGDIELPDTALLVEEVYN